METRVRSLEDKFIAIEMKLDRIADDVRTLAAELKDLARVVGKLTEEVREIKGRLSEIPSTWQMVGICATMITLVVSSIGAAFAFAKYLQV